MLLTVSHLSVSVHQNHSGVHVLNIWILPDLLLSVIKCSTTGSSRGVCERPWLRFTLLCFSLPSLRPPLSSYTSPCVTGKLWSSWQNPALWHVKLGVTALQIGLSISTFLFSTVTPPLHNNVVNLLNLWRDHFQFKFSALEYSIALLPNGGGFFFVSFPG